MTTGNLRLATAKVVLRDFELDDLDGMYEVVSDDRVTRWLSFDSKTREQTAHMISRIVESAQEIPRTEFELAVTLPSGGRVIGLVRLELCGVKAGKLGYAIGANYWGNGYATAAARAIVSFGFEHLGLRRISAAIGPHNQASLAIAHSLGMTLEGRIRDHVYTNGAWRDSLLLAVLAPEWNGRMRHSP